VLNRGCTSRGVNGIKIIYQGIEKEVTIETTAFRCFNFADSLVEERIFCFPFDYVEVTIHANKDVTSAHHVFVVKVPGVKSLGIRNLL
jgi:hypothetical protein